MDSPSFYSICWMIFFTLAFAVALVKKDHRSIYYQCSMVWWVLGGIAVFSPLLRWWFNDYELAASASGIGGAAVFGLLINWGVMRLASFTPGYYKQSMQLFALWAGSSLDALHYFINEKYALFTAGDTRFAAVGIIILQAAPALVLVLEITKPSAEKRQMRSKKV